MATQNFEVCLYATSIKTVLNDLRLLLAPIGEIPVATLECVEANYSDELDALIMRFCFSRDGYSETQQAQLVAQLSSLGLQAFVPQHMSLRDRGRFNASLVSNYQVCVLRYPSQTNTQTLVTEILDTLEQHLAEDEIEMPTRPDWQVTPERMETFGMLDEMIENLALGTHSSIPKLPSLPTVSAPLTERAETFGTLDSMIANLPTRAGTADEFEKAFSALTVP